MAINIPLGTQTVYVSKSVLTDQPNTPGDAPRDNELGISTDALISSRCFIDADAGTITELAYGVVAGTREAPTLISEQFANIVYDNFPAGTLINTPKRWTYAHEGVVYTAISASGRVDGITSAAITVILEDGVIQFSTYTNPVDNIMYEASITPQHATCPCVDDPTYYFSIDSNTSDLYGVDMLNNEAVVYRAAIDAPFLIGAWVNIAPPKVIAKNGDKFYSITNDAEDEIVLEGAASTFTQVAAFLNQTHLWLQLDNNGDTYLARIPRDYSVYDLFAITVPDNFDLCQFAGAIGAFSNV